MKRALAILLTLGALIGSSALTAQEKKPAPAKPDAAKPGAKKQPEMSPEMKKAMETYEKAAQPGPNHKFLAQFAGTWEGTVKMWMGPGEPEVTKGVSENTMILGGRYLRQEVVGTAMGKPFHGMGLTGYDNVSKQFVMTWVDDMGTGIETGTGSLDASGKVLNSMSTFNDPMTGGATKTRGVLRIVDPDKHVMEMYGAGPDGKEMLMMEITYVRKKK